DLVPMLGSRITTVTEIPPQMRFDPALLKAMLSGGDPMHLRGLYESGERANFTCTLWTSGNDYYGPPPNDDAAYEREAVLPFKHQVPKEERDDNVERQTIDPSITGEAFLAVAVRGFSRLYGELHGRLTPPKVVTEATLETRDAVDRWTTVLEEIAEFTGNRDDAVAKKDLWEHAKLAKEGELGDRQRC